MKTPEFDSRMSELLARARTLSPEEQRSLLDRLRATEPQVSARLEQLLSQATRPFAEPTSAFPAANSEERPASLAPGTRVGDYEIEAEIGRGGMGIVYRARQVGLERTVALKTILLDVAALSPLRERLRREALAVARLQHPNVVQVHEVGEEQGTPYLVLEYVSGGSLADRIDGQPLAPLVAANLLEKLARAVQHAHSHGIIHRDLKPANVLLEMSREPPAGGDGAVADNPRLNDAVPKIADFGLARRIDSTDTHTQTGAVVGTPSYMAPEQIDGRFGEIGPAADIHALGAILYELLTGRPPYRGGSPWETMKQVTERDPVPPALLTPVPRDLETICLACLRKDPARRYPSAGALADDLRCFQEGRPILARPAGRIERLAKWTRRHPAGAGMILVCLLALAGFIVFGAVHVRALEEHARELTDANRELEEANLEKTRQRDTAERRRKEAERALYVVQVHRAQRAWDSNEAVVARSILASLKPDVETSGAPFEWSYLRRIFHTERHVLALADAPGEGAGGSVEAAAFSPDGRYLAAARGERVRVWEADTGRTVCDIPGVKDRLRALGFRKNSSELVAIGLAGTVVVWEVPAGREKSILRGKSELGANAVLDSTSDRLACSGMVNQVAVWDVAGQRQLHQLTTNLGLMAPLAFSPDGKWLAGASLQGPIVIWPVSGGAEPISITNGHKGRVVGLAFSTDSRRLVSSGDDGTLRIWGWEKEGQQLALATAPPGRIAVSPDGLHLAVAGRDRVVQVWRVEGTPPVLTALHLFRGHGEPISALAFGADGRLIASGEKDDVRVWNALEPPDCRTLSAGPPVAVMRLVYRPDGRLLASSRLGNLINFWTLPDGKLARTLTVFDDDGEGDASIIDVAFRNDHLFSATGSRTDVWESDKGTRRFSLFPMNGGHGLAVSRDGRRLACSKHLAVLVWDSEAIEQAQARGDKSAPPPALSLPVESNVFSLAFSPDGMWLATSTGQEPTRSIVRVWHLRTGKERLRLPEHHGMPADVTFSPDGRLLATSDGNEAKLWDSDSGELQRALRGHAGPIWGVAFSPDGRRLATASADRTAKLWELVDGQEVLTLSGHRGTVYRAIFHPDGRQIATCSADGTVRLWDADPPPGR